VPPQSKTNDSSSPSSPPVASDTTGEYQCYWYSGETFEITKLEYQATETLIAKVKLERASYRAFFVGTKYSTLVLRQWEEGGEVAGVD